MPSLQTSTSTLRCRCGRELEQQQRIQHVLLSYVASFPVLSAQPCVCLLTHGVLTLVVVPCCAADLHGHQ
jgi:hypothetical protein